MDGREVGEHRNVRLLMNIWYLCGSTLSNGFGKDSNQEYAWNELLALLHAVWPSPPESARVHQSLAESGGLWRTNQTKPDSPASAKSVC